MTGPTGKPFDSILLREHATFPTGVDHAGNHFIFHLSSVDFYIINLDFHLDESSSRVANQQQARENHVASRPRDRNGHLAPKHS